jgi:HAD superfamily hydrolase (TIGR01450 family)
MAAEDNPRVPLSPAVRPYDHVLLDLDGCLWIGDEPTDRAQLAVTALREAGKRLRFLTNDPRPSGEDFVRKLWRLGFQASLDEIASVGAAVQHALVTRPGGGSAFVIGSRAMIDHVAAAGLRIVNRTEFASRADVVVVAGHDDFDFGELRTATQAVLRGADLVGASRDPSFPMPDGPWPGTGALLAAVETATGVTAGRIIGKPERPFYEAALERLGPGRALGVGDRLELDVAGAHAAGIDAALVLTGGATAQQAAAADPAPRHVAASLAALVLGA